MKVDEPLWGMKKAVMAAGPAAPPRQLNRPQVSESER